MISVLETAKPSRCRNTVAGLLAHPGMERHPAMVDDTLPRDGGDEQEVWRPIPSLPGYEASSYGRIRSVDRLKVQRGPLGQTITRRLKGKVLRLSRCRPRPGVEYEKFNMHPGKNISVHRCVCEAFHGPAPSREHEVAHLNGKPLDNRADNLTWKTHVENEDDKRRHGTLPCGEKQWMSHLKEEDIETIFFLRSKRRTQRFIADVFGITQSHVSAILARKMWSHVKIGGD